MSETGSNGAAGCVVSIIMMLVGLGIYAFFAYCLMIIAQKTDTENAWMAWVPLLNVYLMLMIAGKPIWWILLFFIPIANIVVPILIWMEIAEMRGKPSWYGILMITPLSPIFLYLMAFQD